MSSSIIYTFTDEAPALATYSLLPIFRAFVSSAGLTFEERDISLAGRILANFSDFLNSQQHVPDALSELGELAKKPEANIIKLPNISASVPQLNEAIDELQKQGFAVPDFPAEPSNDLECEIKARYGRVLGSAVNPVLREGNSDRRVAAPVKEYARRNAHRMGKWSPDSKTHVASMTDGDFFGSEQSTTMLQADSLQIDLVTGDGQRKCLKSHLAVQPGEVIDASCMSARSLRAFVAEQFSDARRSGILFSLHLKATMMKVSDPIIFGYAVSVFLEDVFTKHRSKLDSLGVDPNNGLATLLELLEQLPDSEEREAIRADIRATFEAGPAIAMVDSDRGITNLHVPSDVIVDASMAAAIRDGGKMWGPDGQLHDAKMLIPDRCYSGVYQAVIDFCRTHGAFDPSTMGNVANVGLMAQKAEEYGSHDKTFLIPADGRVEVLDSQGHVLLQHAVQSGDIWRMCQTKDLPIRDWVRLAVQRASATGTPAVFWLDENRAHDAQIIAKVKQYLTELDTRGLEIDIMPPAQAATHACQRAKAGQDTISVTGNVLRDYLTDLFPILELGTSAKMLSIVPLLAGGGLYETGAGGSAPKHVEQFIQEGHLRWDSLGEFLAVGASLGDLAHKTGDNAIRVLADTLNQAIGRVLDENRSPMRKVHELDTRGSHFYLALYWAHCLATQNEHVELKQRFSTIASQLDAHQKQILDDLNRAQGHKVDLGGYYRPCPTRVAAAMRPSGKFNEILSQLQ
jgi:isocitrate dehydrogenase